jgi:hypothetical protein
MARPRYLRGVKSAMRIELRRSKPEEPIAVKTFPTTSEKGGRKSGKGAEEEQENGKYRQRG